MIFLPYSGISSRPLYLKPLLMPNYILRIGSNLNHPFLVNLQSSICFPAHFPIFTCRTNVQGVWRGCKCTIWHGGSRAISFWRWPGHWKPHPDMHLTAHLDVLPTLCELTGATLPSEFQSKLDGYSLLPARQLPTSMHNAQSGRVITCYCAVGPVTIRIVLPRSEAINAIPYAWLKQVKHVLSIPKAMPGFIGEYLLPIIGPCLMWSRIRPASRICGTRIHSALKI